MSLFKRIFSEFSGAGSKVPLEELAKDMSKPAEERGRDIARSVNRTGHPGRYYDFRQEQMQNAEQQFEAWKDTSAVVRRLHEDNMQHTRSVRELAQMGEQKLLEKAPLLQGAENDLRHHWHETQKRLHTARHDGEQLKDTFTMLAAAEQHITQLTGPEKTYSAGVLKMAQQYADQIQQMTASLPPENKDLENAVAQARQAIIARDNQAREAVIAAEAMGRKIKFNEYLNTGLATSTAVTAPKTARFTRKPKAVQTVGP